MRALASAYRVECMSRERVAGIEQSIKKNWIRSSSVTTQGSLEVGIQAEPQVREKGREF